VFPIAETGQQVTLAPGSHLTALGCELGTVPGGAFPSFSGPSPCIDGNGRVAFRVSGTNGKSAALRSSFDAMQSLYNACPVITTQLHTQYRVPGQAVSFTVSATGAAPLTYRWSLNGNQLFDGPNVSGSGTPTLDVHAVSLADAGAYAVRVTNSCGFTISNDGVLEVGAGIPYCFGDGSGTSCPCANSSDVDSGTGCRNAFGGSGRLRADGHASLSSDTVVLHGTQMQNSSVLYFQGTAQTSSGMGQVFGDGLRCAGGTIVRLGIKLNVAGASQFPGPLDPALATRGGVTSPSVRNYQAWYRDSQAFCTQSTFNLTNGVSITWNP
jgi:hypothetical protein